MSRMTLGKKITLGFGVLVAITFCIGSLALWNMKDVSNQSRQLARQYAPQVKLFTRIQAASLQNMSWMRGYLLTADERYLKEAKKHLQETRKLFQQALQLAARSDQLKELKAQIDKATARLEHYQALTARARRLNRTIVEARRRLDRAGEGFRRACNAYLDEQNRSLEELVRASSQAQAMLAHLSHIAAVKDVLVRGGKLQVETFKSQALRDPRILERAVAQFDKVAAILARLKSQTRDPKALERLQKAQAAVQTYARAVQDLLKSWFALQKVEQEQRATARAILAEAQANASGGLAACQKVADRADELVDTASLVVTVGLGVALLLSLVLGWGLVRSITGPINRAIASLNQGSDQIAAASSQVSASSQSLAEGASQQAAALEETSSSLEEMASMTKQNADNAGQARQMVQETQNTVTQASQAMERLRQSMEKINAASDETAKIIKTIDEIAFQTNLLALNAAVEAARAGEAGAGFAVVADEVRNLAMRAAEAAKNTQEIIEDNIAHIKQGHELVVATDEAFNQVRENARKVAELVTEISAASAEQAQGIDQINRAVAEMDKVTQQVAANAEQSASASEELSAQAEAMRAMVQDLVALVGGVRLTAGALPEGEQKDKKLRLLPRPKKEGGAPAPEKLIPLDEDDESFTDF